MPCNGRKKGFYRETGWLPLSDGRLYQILILMYKIKNRMVPSDLTSIFLRNTDHPLGYNSRSRIDFVTLPRRTTLSANSFVPSASDSWNSLTEQLRNNPSIGKGRNAAVQAVFDDKSKKGIAQFLVLDIKRKQNFKMFTLYTLLKYQPTLRT